MSKFSSRLSRYNTICCEQVMPVPVIPVCAVSCCLPRPICEFKQSQCFVPPPQPPQPCNPPHQAIQNAPLEAQIEVSPIKIPNYCAGLPDPPSGSILTISSTTIPAGYLAADGSEVSRTAYSALFLVIGTYYGDGNGSTTFNLPNLSCDSSNGCVVSYIIKT
jgi:hypothetical protein